MSDHVETMAYAAAGGVPWHGYGIPVDNNMPVGEMLVKSGLDWTVSARPLYFPEDMTQPGKKLRIAPEERALVRDTDLMMLDTVGPSYIPVQNADIFDFFKRFCEAGDMQMETAGSLKNGKFIWVLARISEGFNLGGKDEMRGYVLLSSPHQYGFSLTAALTPVRVVCWNTISYALGSDLSGGGGKNSARFRMVHSRAFDADVKAEAERALGLANANMKAFNHNAELLSGVKASNEDVTDFFYSVLQLERPEDDTEAANADNVVRLNANLKRFQEALPTQPGAELFKDTWWNAFNAVTYVVDHQLGRDENRLFNAWFGNSAGTKRRALELAVDYAKIVA